VTRDIQKGDFVKFVLLNSQKNIRLRSNYGHIIKVGECDEQHGCILTIAYGDRCFAIRWEDEVKFG